MDLLSGARAEEAVEQVADRDVQEPADGQHRHRDQQVAHGGSAASAAVATAAAVEPTTVETAAGPQAADQHGARDAGRSRDTGPAGPTTRTLDPLRVDAQRVERARRGS